MLLPDYIRRCGARVDLALRGATRRLRGHAPARLVKAMEYTLFAPAKRIRPVVVFALCEAAGVPPARATPAAVAVELIHTYSLIHDDLPCMDDDDFRRGRPSSHKVYGDAGAVLAGDALQAAAFGELSRARPPGRAAALVAELARGAGAPGMVGGQLLDLAVTNGLRERVNALKTAALFEASARMGAVSAGAPAAFVRRAGMFGQHLGLAFQYADDRLDKTFDPAEADRRARKHAKAALAALRLKGRMSAILEDLTRLVVERDK